MNYIAYRTPGEEPRYYECGAAIDFRPEEDTNGFVVAPFSPDKRPLFFRFKRSLDALPSGVIGENEPAYDFKEFSRKEYEDYVKATVECLKGDLKRKIVTSRRLILKPLTDAGSVFDALCEAFPDTFVFFISTEVFGTWISATPELLLRKRGSCLETMALAGTRLARGDSYPWDEKNIREQEIVTDYISEIFKANGIVPSVGKIKTRRAGIVEHLMTPVTGSMQSEGNQLLYLLHRLSPTPALSGFPREEALSLIQSFEGDRALYGGYAGPVDSNGDFSFYVIIRCATLSASSSVLFAGGGVTALSQPEAEWEETENKFSTLRRFFS